MHNRNRDGNIPAHYFSKARNRRPAPKTITPNLPGGPGNNPALFYKAKTPAGSFFMPLLQRFTYKGLILQIAHKLYVLSNK